MLYELQHGQVEKTFYSSSQSINALDELDITLPTEQIGRHYSLDISVDDVACSISMDARNNLGVADVKYEAATCNGQWEGTCMLDDTPTNTGFCQYMHDVLGLALQ